MAKADNSPSTTEIGKQIEREDREKQIARRKHFEDLYAEWLLNRSETLSKADDRTMQDDDAHSYRERWLAREITTTPAVLPWMIAWKLDVLEHYLGEGTNWTDNREIVMLAGIKADLLSYGFIAG